MFTEKIENLRELQEHEVDTSEWQSTDGYNTINDALIGRKDGKNEQYTGLLAQIVMCTYS